MVETVVTVERTTTTQTAAPASGGGLSALKINIGYFQTYPGAIKLVQFVSINFLSSTCAYVCTPDGVKTGLSYFKRYDSVCF